MQTHFTQGENAMDVVGPAAFGYDVAFRPLPGGVIGRRPRRFDGKGGLL